MILDKIVRHKRNEIAAAKKKKPLEALRRELGARRGTHRFQKALSSAKDVAVIAEIKRRSPSKGLLRKKFDPVLLARDFSRSGASALSVLTDEKFFGGSLPILKKVRASTRLPILRKDFMLDEYQVYEAALAGADAILLIAAILTPRKLEVLSALAASLGLDVLFEVHDKKDVEKILPLKPRLAGINNRDLRTFDVDLKATEKLAGMFPRKTLLVSESGIFTRTDIERVKRAGASAVLVGESLMKAASPGRGLEALLRKE